MKPMLLKLIACGMKIRTELLADIVTPSNLLLVLSDYIF
jgi:hypothetical protein